MRILYLSLALSCLSAPVQAQHYRPVQPGLLHQFTTAAGDSTYGVILNRTGTRLGTDSTYKFSPRLGRKIPSFTFSCLPRFADSPFGSSLRVRNPGTFQVTYTLRDATGQKTMLLQPYAPLNQTWQATQRLTAQVTARAIVLVLGQPDSVVTITFSNGRTLALSKRLGLVNGIAPLDCMLNAPIVRTLVLTALPTRHLGVAVLGALAIYDFQPGETFYYEARRGPLPFASPATSITRYADSIISRTTSRTGDTIHYRVWHYIPTPAPGRTGSYLGTTLVTATIAPLLQIATGQFLPTTANRRNGVFLGDVVPNRYGWPNGRTCQPLRYSYGWCGATPADSVSIRTSGQDNSHDYVYGAGLGQTYYCNEDVFTFWENTALIGYRKGTERWGTSFRIQGPLAARATSAGATSSAAPNPFSATLTVHCSLIRPQALKLEMRDALGRTVLTLPTQALPAGSQQVNVPTAVLSNSFYTLHLHWLGEGRSEVLKVVKAD